MKKKNFIISSLVTIALCASMIVGSTFALFTSESKVNIAVTSGKVSVVANIDETSVQTKQLYDTEYEDGKDNMYEGVATFNAEGLTLEKFVPGDGIKFNIVVKNESTVSVKYRTIISCENDDGLFAGLNVNIAGIENYNGNECVAYWETIEINSADIFVPVTIELPEGAGNEYQDKTCTVSYKVEAVQGNANTVDDTWDGTADTSWYDPANPQDEYDIGTAEQIAGLSELVSGDTTFDGVTFTLVADVDLYCEDTTPSADGDPLTFRPIGDHSKGGTFEGVFDGNGKTISNIYQNGWDLGYEWGKYGSYGLFGNVNNATIKNLTLTGGESYIEGGDTSFVAGSATGTCVFENITITDSISATYNNGNGGIIGWSGEGNYTFKNITIAEDCVLAGLWGSFDSSIGGIVGQAEPGATYNFENVNVACRIDAYNDCTASYDYYNYRMCGMLIGRMEETTTINGENYPDTSKYNLNFTDVTVTYGDWANYHYCRANGARAQRVEAGYAYDGIAADYDHSQCTAHCKELIEFDQIFGGDQYAVKGLPSYDGVTVIYNNKQG